MKRAAIVFAITCLTLVLVSGVAVAAKKPAAQFPSNAKLTMTSVPPFFYVFTWTAATGTFDSYRLDLVKTGAKTAALKADAGRATRYTVETVQGEGYPYVSPGEYKVTVNAMSGGTVAASLALKGTVKLK